MDKIKLFFTNKKTIIVVSATVLAILVAAILLYIYFKPTDTSIVKGVDVSAYQGEIDFKKLENQEIYFAYIKATEGKDHIDKNFDKNWKRASETSIKVGAYHFVNFNIDGNMQANFFIDHVPKEGMMLPPVIDIELYGEYLDKIPDKTGVKKMLTDIITRLESFYGIKPIIYTNYHTYETFIQDDFNDIGIWIADYSNQKPELKGKHQWVFWQYTTRGLLKGYTGNEKFIDMNLFNGDLNAFNQKFIKKVNK